MAIRKIAFSATLVGANGAAVGSATVLVNGRIVGVYLAVGDLPNTTDVTIKGIAPDQTILTITDLAASAWYYPRSGVHGATGAALTYDGTRTVNEAIPVDGYVTISGAQGNAVVMAGFLLVED
jgi:hypothetical protein